MELDSDPGTFPELCRIYTAELLYLREKRVERRNLRKELVVADLV